MPLLLIASAVRTYQQLEDQKHVYLRSRVAALAGLLETMPTTLPESNWPAALAEQEPALDSLAIFDRDSSPPGLDELWSGREFYRTENQPGIFRAWVPVHHSGRLRLARIDVAEKSADFLVAHARHHLILVGAGSLLILFLFGLHTRAQRRTLAAERKQAELEQLARLGTMSAVLAHEIRNPLGAIKGYAQLLLENASADSRPLLDPILAETSRLERLVQDLLLYGRPSAPTVAAVHSSQIAGLAERHARLFLAPANIHFQSDVSPFRLQTDLSLVEQVLLNLLRNSAEALRDQPGGRVGLTLLRQGSFAILRLVDNGPGLSPLARQHLYQPFFTSKASGTGLGLAISRQIAQSLGGDFSLANQPAGGAIAELRLPLAGPGH